MRKTLALAVFALGAFSVSMSAHGNIPDRERRKTEPARNVPDIAPSQILRQIPFAVDLKEFAFPPGIQKEMAWVKNDAVEVEAKQLRTVDEKVIYFVNIASLRNGGIVSHYAIIICRLDVQAALKEMSASGKFTPNIEAVLVVLQVQQDQKTRIGTFLKQSYEEELRTNFPELVEMIDDIRHDETPAEQ